MVYSRESIKLSEKDSHETTDDMEKSETTETERFFRKSQETACPPKRKIVMMATNIAPGNPLKLLLEIFFIVSEIEC